MTTLATDPAAVAGRREERKQANRDKLLAAARKVFAEKGVGAASARDIVRETDLATGTFYNYFDDKLDVFRALVEESAERHRAAVREQRQQPGRSLEERVEGAYRAYFELVLEDHELFTVLMRNSGLIALVAEENVFEVGIAELLEDLRDWAREGDLPPLDLDYLATAMVGVGFQVATHLIDRRPPDAEGAAEFCSRLFVGGIRALAGEPAASAEIAAA